MALEPGEFIIRNVERTLANTSARTFLGKVLQEFNRTNNWQQTANAFNGFALAASGVVAAPVFGPLALDGVYAIGWQGLVPAANAGMAATYRYGPQIAQGTAFVGSLFSPAGQMPSVSGPYATSEVNGFVANQLAQAAGIMKGP